MNKKLLYFTLIGLLSTGLAYGEKMKPKDPINGPTYCEQIVSLHGLLSRAQFQCGYEKYNSELIDDSAKCFKHELGDDYGKKVLKFGMLEFDRNEKEIGHKKICAELLKAYPQYIKN